MNTQELQTLYDTVTAEQDLDPNRESPRQETISEDCNEIAFRAYIAGHPDEVCHALSDLHLATVLPQVEVLDDQDRQWSQSVEDFKASNRWNNSFDAYIQSAIDNAKSNGSGNGSKTRRLSGEEALREIAAQGGKAGKQAEKMLEPTRFEQMLAQTRCAADIETELLTFTFDGRLIVGALNSLIGMEGIGKSLILMLLAALASRDMLENVTGDVLILASEDSIESVVIPRLAAAGADLSRIHILPSLALTREDDRDALRQLIHHYNAGLTILDPLSSALGGGIDMYRENEVRAVLDPLADIAQETGTTIVTNGHVTKDPTADIRNRAIGSRAFTAAPRSVLACMDHQGSMLLVQIKQNYGKADTVEYRIESRSVALHGIEHNVGVAVLGHTVDVAIHEVGKARSQVDICADWLVTLLSESEEDMYAADIKTLAEDEGFSASTLRSARTKTGIKTRRVGMPAKTIWYIPDVDFGESA